MNRRLCSTPQQHCRISRQTDRVSLATCRKSHAGSSPGILHTLLCLKSCVNGPNEFPTATSPLKRRTKDTGSGNTLSHFTCSVPWPFASLKERLPDCASAWMVSLKGAAGKHVSSHGETILLVPLLRMRSCPHGPRYAEASVGCGTVADNAAKFTERHELLIILGHLA